MANPHFMRRGHALVCFFPNGKPLSVQSALLTFRSNPAIIWPKESTLWKRNAGRGCRQSLVKTAQLPPAASVTCWHEDCLRAAALFSAQQLVFSNYHLMNNSQIALIAKFVKIHIVSCRTRTGAKSRQGGIQYDRRVLDTLPEQAADDAGVATELCGSVFSAF